MSSVSLLKTIISQSVFKWEMQPLFLQPSAFLGVCKFLQATSVLLIVPRVEKKERKCKGRLKITFFKKHF